MTQEDKYLFAQLGLTFSLLITAVFLLKPAVFWQYQLFLIGGTLAGFAFGWYNRKGAFEEIKYFTDAAILITITWMGYQIFKSTFLYKEVIAILVQGIIILEIIFSFNFSAQGKTAYIRILSLLIFMASPVFAIAHAYNILLAIAYLLIWLAILRFQFAGFLQPLKEQGSRRYYSPATSLVCFLAALFLAWFISSNVYLGRIKKGMFLLDEDLQDTGSGGDRESEQADKFYSLQDDLLNKLTGLAMKLDSYEKRRQLIYLLSELIKDTIRMMEVDKAEAGLVDILKREGPGLEGTKPLITLLKEYVNKKNSLGIQKNKEEIMDALKKRPMGIVDKIKIISLVNKIQQANSYQQSQENSKALQTAIKNSQLNKSAKKEVSLLARSLVNLKAFELYRRNLQNLEERIQSPGEPAEKEISDTVLDIKHAAGLDDFKQTAKKIRQLKADARINAQKSGKDTLKGLEESLRIKLGQFVAEKTEKIRKIASDKLGVGSGSEEFDKKVDGAESASRQQEFTKELSGLSQQNKANNLGLANALKDMLELKTESFEQAQIVKLDNLMNKNLPAEIKKEVNEFLEAMEEKNNSNDLQDQLENLTKKMSDFEKQGKISVEDSAELLKTSGEIKDILSAGLEAASELKEKESPENYPQERNYREKLRQAIENSSLSGEEKEMLNSLSQELFKAQSLPQLGDVKEAMENKLSSLGPRQPSSKGVADLEAAVNNIFSDLEKKIDSLEEVGAEQIKQLQQYLKKMQQSRDSEELQKSAEEFKDAIKFKTPQNKQAQEKLLEAVDKLKEILAALIEKSPPSATELKEINRINEEIRQAAQIKQQFLIGQALSDILEKTENLSLQDAAKAQELEKKLQELRKASTPEELEKAIMDLKNIIHSESAQENKAGKMEQAGRRPWKIYILSSPLVVSKGATLLLKVIIVYENGYIKELTKDIEWFSADPQVARVDDVNFLHALADGKTIIKGVYKGIPTRDTEVTVVTQIDAQTVREIQQELPR